MENLETFKKIYHDDKLEDLYALYARVDKEVESAKGRRLGLVFIGYFIACLFLLIAVSQPSDLGTVIGCLVVAFLSSGAIHFFNISIYGWVFTKNQEDSERVERIKLRIKFAKERQC